MMNSESEYHNVTKWLDGSRRPMLITHRRPDGDALGALGGLAMALRQRGIEPLAALFDPFPPRYALIQDAAEWYQWDRDRAKLEAECDGLIILDTCALTQLEPIADYLPQAPRTLVLDHHTTRDDIGTRPGDLRLIDESASAVALMVAEWAQAAGVKMEPLLATALLVGISTDCGWFRFSNTDARTLRVSADLVAAGANASEIHAAIYEQDAPEKLGVIARMLASLETARRRKAGGDVHSPVGPHGRRRGPERHGRPGERGPALGVHRGDRPVHRRGRRNAHQLPQQTYGGRGGAGSAVRRRRARPERPARGSAASSTKSRNA